MFDTEEMAILNALEKGELTRSIDADEEIALARMAAKEYLSKSKKYYNSSKSRRCNYD